MFYLLRLFSADEPERGSLAEITEKTDKENEVEEQDKKILAATRLTRKNTLTFRLVHQ